MDVKAILVSILFSILWHKNPIIRMMAPVTMRISPMYLEGTEKVTQ